MGYFEELNYTYTLSLRGDWNQTRKKSSRMQQYFSAKQIYITELKNVRRVLLSKIPYPTLAANPFWVTYFKNFYIHIYEHVCIYMCVYIYIETKIAKINSSENGNSQ